MQESTVAFVIDFEPSTSSQLRYISLLQQAPLDYPRLGTFDRYMLYGESMLDARPSYMNPNFVTTIPGN